MRAILEDIRSGEIQTYEVPIPELRDGGILVRTAFSAISAGTERAKVESLEKSLLGKALARPELVKQVLDFARTNGIKAAYDKVQTKLSTLSTMGYSCAGTVMAVGKGVTDFQRGDRVACGGAGLANHSEVNWIPNNLAVRVPDSVGLDAASLTTIGAIATQGLRQAQVNFGETVAVIGAGLVGVLTMQLARAAGCRVIAIDLDAARVAKAAEFGAHIALVSSDPNLSMAIEQFSSFGPDAVIVTAATRSAEPLELAAKVLRDRGRIVVVGDVGMGVSRPHMYHKELTLVMSRSYGPGRYDPGYEEQGHDYPIGFVRWTERRNMQVFLDFLAAGTINVAPLLARRYPVEEGKRAYSELRAEHAYTAIIEYPTHPATGDNKTLPQASASSPSRTGRLRLGCIGAGGFAASFIFPHLKAASKVVSLEAVATATGVTAESARRNFGFARTQTVSGLLRDPELDAVFIASRHQSHAEYVAEALREGKAVFVEKPLAVDCQQLEMLKHVYRDALENRKAPFVMVGFNRRFAPFTIKTKKFFVGHHEPMIIHARLNAGFIPVDHWSQQSAEGGRIIGEMCHFVDWARFMTGKPIVKITSSILPNGNRYNSDNVAADLTFADGSVASLLYLANGDSSVPKEYYEVFCEGGVARLEDFVTLELARNRKTTRFKSRRDKGHANEIRATVEAMAAGGQCPIPFEELVEVTEATFSIAESTSERRSSSPAEAPTPLELTSP